MTVDINCDHIQTAVVHRSSCGDMIMECGDPAPLCSARPGARVYHLPWIGSRAESRRFRHIATTIQYPTANKECPMTKDKAPILDPLDMVVDVAFPKKSPCRSFAAQPRGGLSAFLPAWTSSRPTSFTRKPPFRQTETRPHCRAASGVSGMVAQLQLERVRVQVVLVLEIGDAVLDHVVPEHRHRHDQRHKFAMVVFDKARQFLAVGFVNAVA